jgi:hypothetical protein
LTQRLQKQHQGHLEEIEQEHRKAIVQLQRDYDKSQEEMDESLQEALSRVARVTKDYQRESHQRKVLEKNLQDLQQQTQVEKKEWQSRHVEELERRRQDWESERETIMVTLQKDVNTAFDARRRNNNTSPRSNGTTGTSPSFFYPHGAGSQFSSTQHQQPHHHPPRPSPLSINSQIFFSEKSTVGMPSPRAAYIAPSPTRPHSSSSSPPPSSSSPPPPFQTGVVIGPPTMISQSYSDIDSVLRETEELVQSVL